MSFERKRYDPCSYEQRLVVTTSPGNYMLQTPTNDCAPCDRDIPADPFIRYQAWGSTTCAPGIAIDDSSELLGLTRKASDCPSKNYLPSDPIQQGKCRAPSKPVDDPRTCRPPTEPTRLSNPPCTLRATGINRWEWLCDNPQDRAIIPFEWNINYRIVAKDNYRPCMANPMDPSPTLPDPVKASEWSSHNYVCQTPAHNGPSAAMRPSLVPCGTISAL